MANLNLSQFGENTSVSNADYTFVWDSANAISKKVSRNSWLNSGTLTSDAPVTISQTWNNAAVAFTGLKVNAAGTSGTNSSAASLLLDLQVGGTSQFTIRKDGAIVLPYGYAGIVDGSVNGGGTNYTWGGPRFGPTAFIAWTATSPAGTLDTILVRDGEADHLAMRRSTNGQKFSVYGTYPGAAWERFTITAPTSGNVLLGTYKGTGGIARGLEFQTDGVTRMSLHPTLGTLDLPAAGTSAGVQQINAARIIYAGEGYRVGSTYQVVFSNGTDYSRGLGASSSGGLAVTNGSTGGQSLQFTEMTAPAAPSANSVRIYAEDDGTGKTRLMALFATGVAQQIAIEP